MRDSWGVLKIVLMALVALSPAASAAEPAARPVFSNRADDYTMREASAAYNKDVSDAVRRRATGNLKRAIEAFSQAARESISEIPNYEIWADLSDLYSRTGRKREGLILLKEYTCASEILAAHRQCFINAENPLEIPNPSIPPLCYAEICHSGVLNVYLAGDEGYLRGPYVYNKRAISRIEADCANNAQHFGTSQMQQRGG